MLNRISGLKNQYSFSSIVPIKPSIVNDRQSRVDRLSVLFETGRIFLNPSLTKWADELGMFPRGAHDDCIDSLSYAIQAYQELLDPVTDWNAVAEMIHTSKSKVSKDVSHVDRYRVFRV